MAEISLREDPTFPQTAGDQDTSSIPVLPANQEGLLSLRGENKSSLSEEVAKNRAARFNLAFGDNSPGVDALRLSIQNGTENETRQQLAMAKDAEVRQIKQQMIQEVAAARQGKLTDEEIEQILSLSYENIQNPATIPEKEFANKIINTLASMSGQQENVYQESLNKDPEGTHQVLDAAAEILTKRELARTKKEDLEAQWRAKGFWGKAGDYVEQVIPFLSWTNTQNAVENAPTSSILPGNNILEQAQYLYTLPVDEFNAQLVAAVDNIAESNVLDALTFVDAILSFSSSDVFLNNAAGIGDLVDAATLGGPAIVRGVAAGVDYLSTTNRLRKAVRDALKTDDVVKDAGKALEQAGEVDKAATVKTIKRQIAERSDDVDTNFRVLEETVPSVFNPKKIFTGETALSREAATRLSDYMAFRGRALIDSLQEVAGVTRLPVEAEQIAIEQAKADLAKTFNRLEDSIIDIKTNEIDPLTNTQSVSLQLGAPNATLFDTPERAEFYARNLYELPEGSFEVRQQGSGFYLDIKKNIDETTPEVRDALITTDNQVKTSFADAFLGWLRSPAETLPQFQSANRNIATTASEEALRRVREAAQDLKLPKAQRKDFERILRANRDFVDPVTGERGRFYESVGALEEGYLKNLGRLPTEAEVRAYFTYVQLSDFDWVVRNLNMYKEKARLGLERWSFEVFKPDAEGRPDFVTTPQFEGKKADYIPWNSDHLSVYVYDPVGRKGQVISRNPMAEDKNMVDDLVRNQGYQIIRIDNPVSRPLKDVLGVNDPIQYVVTKGAANAPLSWKQVGYRPGGHVEYKYNWWVKQPKLYQGEGGTAFYEGDATVFNFSTKAQADKFTKAMETARKLLKAKDEVGLENFLKRNLPYNVKTFKKLFEEERLADGTIKPPALDIDQEFRTTSSGRKIGDEVDFRQRYKSFRDLSSGEYNLSDGIDRQFTGQRDETLLTPTERGSTESSPLFEFHKSSLVDPMSTLERAVTSAVRNRFLNDYKVSAAESFIQRYAGVMKTDLNTLRQNPLYYLHNPDWDRGVADKGALSAAMLERQHILRFLGVKSELEQKVGWVQEKIASSIYNVAGEKMANITADAFNLAAIRDPLSFIRATAFHSKLGLFNPVQLFVQAQGWTHIAALSPQNVLQATAGYGLMRTLRYTNDENIIKHYAKIATKFGWKAEEFEESYRLLRSSGFDKVGRETAQFDDVFKYNLFQGAWGSFLDKGTFFFQESESMIRVTSWNAAYREFRKANPTKTIGNRELGQILTRADTLSVNMTRASKSVLEQGITSIPLQFTSYHLRMMDQLLGKRLTQAEKARAFVAYSAMYGIPIGVGSFIGYPIYEDIRKKALEYGVNLSDPFISAMTEGIPSTVISMITGQQYNVADRYGPGGLDIIKDILTGDKAILEIFGGASGGLINDIFKSAYPVFAGTLDVFKGDSTYEPVLADLIDATRNISSVNNTLRTLMALNTGKYITKNEMYIGDMTKFDAIFSAITGLTPIEIQDTFLKSDSLKNQRELENEVKKEFIKNYRRALKEGAAGNKEGMDAFLKKARAAIIVGDINPTLYSQFVREALSGHTSLMERINQDWFRKAPLSQIQQRIDQINSSNLRGN